MGRRRKDYRVVVTFPDDTGMPPIHYATAHTAIKGAIWYADHHPSSHVRVQRYDASTARYVGVTETKGAARR